MEKLTPAAAAAGNNNNNQLGGEHFPPQFVDQIEDVGGVGEEEEEDHFDKLPDSLLLSIFNKMADIKALGKCCVVSKRFHCLASQVDNVVVKVDCVISGEDAAAANSSNSGAAGGSSNSGGAAKNRGASLTSFVRYVYGNLLKPFQALQHLLSPKRFSNRATSSNSSSSNAAAAAVPPAVSHHSPGEVLRNFREIQKLRIELPGGELAIEEDIVLKWKAEFGSSVEGCVILGAYSDKKRLDNDEDKSQVHEDTNKVEDSEVIPQQQQQQQLENHQDVVFQPQESSGLLQPGSELGYEQHEVYQAYDQRQTPYEEQEQQQQQQQQPQDDNGSIPESFYTDGSLKSRVVWTISSLIAASARHYLLQQIICEHPNLDSLVLTDADGQGTLCMDREQLDEFRNKPLATSTSANRTQVPALNMKLWYAPSLGLPDGSVLTGATLVAIRPSDEPYRTTQKEMQNFIGEAFEEPYKSAAALLVKRRTYLLEMNSF